MLQPGLGPCMIRADLSIQGPPSPYAPVVGERITNGIGVEVGRLN